MGEVAMLYCNNNRFGWDLRGWKTEMLKNLRLI